MANQEFENWWKNINEDDCGIYYRDRWYSNEQELNNEEFYISNPTILYLGSSAITFKYQKDLYLLSNVWYSYEELHQLGYSRNPSSNKSFFNKTTGDVTIGFYNSVEGYYTSGKWYSSIELLSDAGFELGGSVVTLYKKYKLKKYEAITRGSGANKEFFISDPEINIWFKESQFDSLDLSYLPSVDTDWRTGTNFSTGASPDNATNPRGYLYMRYYKVIDSSGKEVSVEDTKDFLTDNKFKIELPSAYVGYRKSDIVGETFWLGTESDMVMLYLYADSTNISYYVNYKTLENQQFCVCFDTEAKVVSVYNSIGQEFSAFNINRNNQDLYYVCDGKKRGWNDINSLQESGFSLTKQKGIYSFSIKAYTDTSFRIPQGYHIEDIRADFAFVFPSYVGKSDDEYDIVSYDGRDSIPDTISSLSIHRTYTNAGLPNLYILQGYRSPGKGTVTGYYYTPYYNNSSSSNWSSFKEVLVNTNIQGIGYSSIYIKGNSNGYASYASLGYPAYIKIYPDLNSDTAYPDYFRMPKSLYRQDGQSIEWLGDQDSTSDLAYYYYNNMVTVYLKADREEDAIRDVYIINILNYKRTKIEYWPHDGYKYKDSFYTEEQLLDLGYHVIRYDKRGYLYTDAISTSYYIYNTTRNSSYNLDLAQYLKTIALDSEIPYYDGSCDIKVETTEFSKREFSSLDQMPSYTEFGNSKRYALLYSIITQDTTPITPFKRSEIGKQLFLLGSTNRNQSEAIPSGALTFHYLKDSWKFPEMDYALLHNPSKDTYDTCYLYDRGYLLQDVCTYKNTEELAQDNYVLVENLVFYLAICPTEYVSSTNKYEYFNLYTDEGLSNLFGWINLGTIARVIELYDANITWPHISWSKAKIRLDNGAEYYIKYDSRHILFKFKEGLIPLFTTCPNMSYNRPYLKSKVTSSTTSISSQYASVLFTDQNFTKPLDLSDVSFSIGLVYKSYKSSFAEMPSSTVTDSNSITKIIYFDKVNGYVCYGTNYTSDIVFSHSPVFFYDPVEKKVYSYAF